MCALFGLIINVNKESSLKAKAKARTKDSTFKAKDSSFVLKDHQGPRPRKN